MLFQVINIGILYKFTSKAKAKAKMTDASITHVFPNIIESDKEQESELQRLSNQIIRLRQEVERLEDANFIQRQDIIILENDCNIYRHHLMREKEENEMYKRHAKRQEYENEELKIQNNALINDRVDLYCELCHVKEVLAQYEPDIRKQNKELYH